MFLIIIANARPTKSIMTTTKKTHLPTSSRSAILSLQTRRLSFENDAGKYPNLHEGT
jgi:hypothetical protein